MNLFAMGDSSLASNGRRATKRKLTIGEQSSNLFAVHVAVDKWSRKWANC